MIQLIIVLVYSAVFYFFNAYDWEHPVIKAFCYLTLFCAIVALSKKPENPQRSNASYCVELLLVMLALFVTLFWFGGYYLHFINSSAACDIGFMTHDAAKMLVFNHQDPYASTTINILGTDPRFWGYKYGPAMILFYLPSAWFTSAAIKVITVVYFLLTLFVLALLLSEHQVKRGFLALASSFLFALLLTLIPERLWFEILFNGSTDILPILLILLSIYAMDKDSYATAGILAGISFSAKFSPALFFILLLVRKKPSLRFFGGVMIGCIPLLAYLAWSGMPMIDNMFLFQMAKKFDSTSLYSVVPRTVRFIFPLIQVSALAGFLLYNFKRAVDTKTLLLHFTLLLLIIEITFTEVHTNHLVWFIPLLSLLFTRYRNPGAASQDRTVALS